MLDAEQLSYRGRYDRHGGGGVTLAKEEVPVLYRGVL